MTYGHLQAECLYTGISSGPNARYRVWEAFTFIYFDYSLLCRISRRQRPHGREFRREGGKLSDDPVRPGDVRASGGGLRRGLGGRVPHGHLLASVRLQLPDVPAGARQGRHVQRIARLRDRLVHLRTIESLAPLCRSVLPSRESVDHRCP